ncbi:alpha/beta hydrolase [Mumia zhuanghuii]|uniref:Alpha/beta fold hydrolase n=2 Tax=Mumia TaxID=1546255 RepID=A0ABW1QN50_9ACTN|nr:MULTISPECIES: alpha/beta hydrolase [Mumia]KAA1419825.1 alpha/beta hydrolase [Mumia zhuanghuii]
MGSFTAFDGTSLAFHASGNGDPLVCVPGGPMLDSEYLGDLGGLATHRQLILLDPRGTGASAVPDDPASYRCDRQVDDVEALREHLELERLDLLGHSAGANVAVRYAERHPGRVDRLLLITPSTMALGVTVSAAQRVQTARLRQGEPWFAEAFRALEDVLAGTAGPDPRHAVEPFWHGRWDAAAQAHHAAQGQRRAAADVVDAFVADGAFAPRATRTALASFDRPVLVLAGEVDLNSPPSAMRDVAAVFPGSRLVVQPGAGHYPWLDDANAFVATVEAFLS